MASTAVTAHGFNICHMDFRTRILAAMKAKGISSQAALGDLVGVQRATVNHWIGGRTDARKVDRETTRRVESVLGVSWHYLLTGEEDLAPSSPSIDESEFVYIPVTNSASVFGTSEYVDVPFYPGVMAGAGVAVDNGSPGNPVMLQFRAESLRRQGINPATCAVIIARGDSMEPQIFDGDAVLYDTSQATPIIDGRMYVVSIDGEEVVKRLQRRPGSRLLVKSDNDQYESYEVDMAADGFRVLGLVRHRQGWV